jgi:hypothetical protein
MDKGKGIKQADSSFIAVYVRYFSWCRSTSDITRIIDLYKMIHLEGGDKVLRLCTHIFGSLHSFLSFGSGT